LNLAFGFGKGNFFQIYWKSSVQDEIEMASIKVVGHLPLD